VLDNRYFNTEVNKNKIAEINQINAPEDLNSADFKMRPFNIGEI